MCIFIFVYTSTLALKSCLMWMNIRINDDDDDDDMHWRIQRVGFRHCGRHLKNNKITKHSFAFASLCIYELQNKLFSDKIACSFVNNRKCAYFHQFQMLRKNLPPNASPQIHQ